MNELSLLALPPTGVETRWASPENPRGLKGSGGQVNGGRKGRPCVRFTAGETIVLAEEPAGVVGTIRRIWLTIDNRAEKMRRGLRLQAYWDGSETPAIDVPLGDFFGNPIGEMVTFESAFFSSPEGRSFCTVLPMPFKSGMRLTLTNTTDTDIALFFYDVDYTIGEIHNPEVGYVHAFYHRENPTTLKEDFTFLPTVKGRGRFLGVHFAVQSDQVRYGRSWWGEGEVKAFLDGDTDYPTLCGTGTEDYIGTGWGQGSYAERYQGCPSANHEALAYTFYRWHVPDPIYFHESIRMTIQQIGHVGGKEKEPLRLLAEEHGETLYAAGEGLVPANLSETGPSGVLYERQDDWASCAFYLLDRPNSV